MDPREQFAAASELAATGRYREARESLTALLQSDPSHIEALILLGKVEYYLGHSAASKRSFEIALSYESGNMAAFFGIEYHRQRMRLLFLVAGVVLLLAMIGGSTAFLAQRMASSVRRLEVALDVKTGAMSAALSESVNRMGSVVEELRGTTLDEQKDTETALSVIRAELEKLRRQNADFMKEIKELRKSVLPGYQPPSPVP